MLPWLLGFVAFLGAYAWVRRDWVWIVGDDSNLLMPAINIGRGLVPNLDFVNGYPGLTFYVQRAIMLVVGETPIAEHVYTAIMAGAFGLTAAWMLRRLYPPALVWLLVFFVWTVTHRLNPTPNPGYLMETLALGSMYWMDRFGTSRRLRDALVAGGIAGLALLFKQPAVFLPVVFLLATSYACLAWPDRVLPTRLRGLVIGANAVILVGFVWTYLGVSVFGVLGEGDTRRSLLLSTVVFVGPWVAAVAGLAVLPRRIQGEDGAGWSIGEGVRANAVFIFGFALVAAIGLAAMYGSPTRIAEVLRLAFVVGPQEINATQSKVLQPLLLWPTVAIALLVTLAPFAIAAVRSVAVRALIFGAACVGCCYTALTYSDLQFTVAGTLIVVAMVAIFLVRAPEDREAWRRLFLFLGATCLLAYLVPHPKYTYSLGILAVSGWFMLGSAAPRRWPLAFDVAGFVVLLAIGVLTVRWADAEMTYMTTFHLGAHTVASYDSAFPAAVDAANATTEADWLSERYDYLVYLAHAP